jgi:hypothetical protein
MHTPKVRIESLPEKLSRISDKLQCLSKLTEYNAAVNGGLFVSGLIDPSLLSLVHCLRRIQVPWRRETYKGIISSGVSSPNDGICWNIQILFVHEVIFGTKADLLASK